MNGDATRIQNEKPTSQNFTAELLQEYNVQPYGRSQSLRDSHADIFRSAITTINWKPPIGNHNSLSGIGLVQSRKYHMRSDIHCDRLGRDTPNSCDQPPQSSSINLRLARIGRDSPSSIRLQIGGNFISSRTGSHRLHGVGIVAPQG